MFFCFRKSNRNPQHLNIIMRGTVKSPSFCNIAPKYGVTRVKWISSVFGCKPSGTCFSCAQRSKPGSNTAAAAPSSVDSGNSTAMPQVDAIKKNSAAAPTNRAQRPRRQPARASARHRRAHSLDAMSQSGVFAARTRTYERNPVQGRRR